MNVCGMIRSAYRIDSGLQAKVEWKGDVFYIYRSSGRLEYLVRVSISATLLSAYALKGFDEV